MITKEKFWRRTEVRLIAQERLSYAQTRKRFEALYREARTLRILPARDRLQGLETDLRLAEALNHLSGR